MASLNAEPALPDERERQQLPPKSYADAVEEEPPVNGVNGIHGTNAGKPTNGFGGQVDGEPGADGHMASVLRIVNTGAGEKEEEKEKKRQRKQEKEEKKQERDDRPQIDRQESKHEYSATVGPSNCACVTSLI